MLWVKGKPLLNKELEGLIDGDVVWVQHHHDGRLRRSEPFRIFRKPDGTFLLFDPRNPSATGEFFVNNMFPDDPDQQVARDIHDGILLFRAIYVEK